ncbi:predicted protein [Naegleria gruberi]|uniref:Predicted protein n=1 Tax=Naegleria gruberi TaxID=5762 RepID=D2VSG1_NAEGR|nr:uncharacterized protein NAEGRDRAFT_71929 [Naegleria gruberi]EFC40116.1 predicted protein [Naegleria gruberi]|eukprot:XP_002672860.1 predicted protein [Naegleria gruberi strain NEG-M]
MPQLEVHVIKGVNLPKMDVGIGAKSDPYVVMKIGKCKHQTTIKKNTLDPIYNETFLFTFENKGEATTSATKLKLQMFDYDKLTKDDKMGKASIVLSGLKKGEVTKHTIKIGPKGNLLIELRALDFGLSADDDDIEQDIKKACYYYFKTPVDEQGNNNEMESEAIQSAAFDEKLIANYLEWQIQTPDDEITTFVRSSLVNGGWFRVMKGQIDDNYYYYKYAGINDEGFEEYDQATEEELTDLDNDMKQWKLEMEYQVDESERKQLYFVTEYLDSATGEYYAVYSDKQHL